MKTLPAYVKAKGFTNWKDYMAWIRSKRTKGRSTADHLRNPRRRSKRKFPSLERAKQIARRLPSLVTSKSRFRHEKIPHRGKLHHIRTIKVGEHRVIIGCPVPTHGKRCPTATVASSILHPKGESMLKGAEPYGFSPRKNPHRKLSWYIGKRAADPQTYELKKVKNPLLEQWSFVYGPYQTRGEAFDDWEKRGHDPLALEGLKRSDFSRKRNLQSAKKNPIAVYNPRTELGSFRGRKLPLADVSIRYRRSSGKHRGELYEHKFRNSVEVYGVPGGRILIVPKRKGGFLWGPAPK